MNNTIETFVERRVELLSSVFLTSRSDIEVFPMEFGGDVTQVARIITADDRNEKIFGIISKGSLGSLKTENEATKFLNKGRVRSQIRPFPFPVLVLAFSMVGDDGYYAWQSEPAVSERGFPGLVIREKLACKPARRDALDLIVEMVTTWHDHFYQQVLWND